MGSCPHRRPPRRRSSAPAAGALLADTAPSACGAQGRRSSKRPFRENLDVVVSILAAPKQPQETPPVNVGARMAADVTCHGRRYIVMSLSVCLYMPARGFHLKCTLQAVFRNSPTPCGFGKHFARRQGSLLPVPGSPPFGAVGDPAFFKHLTLVPLSESSSRIRGGSAERRSGTSQTRTRLGGRQSQSRSGRSCSRIIAAARFHT